MELEQRVKALEFELKILKNEIQHTITQVHELVLAQYAAEAAAAVSKPAESPTPVIKAVPLAEIRHAQHAIVAEEHHEHLKRLEVWAKGSIERLGSGRVGRLVTLFAERGYLLDVDRKQLIEVVARYEDTGPIKAPLTQVLDAVLKLDELLDRAADGEEALQIIEEANLG
ncbi:MAG: hypothetical protein HY868_11330 [Chloroflexi bacterium]|nr:hypothetical protein [Chloroflexota bacterium]